MGSSGLFDVSDLKRSFPAPVGRERVRALDGVDLHIQRGEFVVLRGPSGCGKSTLLLTLGSLRRPSEGSVRFEGRELYELRDRERRALRSESIGFVFQEMHLLPYLDALSNVALASNCASRAAANEGARVVLEGLGLGDRLFHKPSALSAGERQRVAVARALVRGPKVLLADEPTGSLDPESSALVLDRLSEFHRGGGTVVLVTHATELALAFETRSVRMRAGRIEADRDSPCGRPSA